MLVLASICAFLVTNVLSFCGFVKALRLAGNRFGFLFPGNFEYDHPEEFAKSQWQKGEKSLIYLVYRWSLAVFFVFSVLYSMKVNIDLGIFSVYFIYWTHLNLCGTMITMLLGAFHITIHFSGQKKYKHSMPLFLKFYWAMWNQSIVFACLISGSYWILLHKDEISLNSILTHLLNVVVPIIDLFIVNHPPRFSQFFYVTFVGVSYGFFTMVYQFIGGLDKNGENFVYPTSDWKVHPYRATFYLVVLAILSVSFHLVFNVVHKIRRKVGEKFEGKKKNYGDEEESTKITVV